MKLYTEPLTEGMVAVANEVTGERLAFRFDPQQLNTVGFSINRGGFGGLDDVAVEPPTPPPMPSISPCADGKDTARLPRRNPPLDVFAGTLGRPLTASQTVVQ